MDTYFHYLQGLRIGVKFNYNYSEFHSPNNEHIRLTMMQNNDPYPKFWTLHQYSILKNIKWFQSKPYKMNSQIISPTLCQKSTYLEFFWSAFSCIRTEYGEIACKKIRTRKTPNTDTFHAVQDLSKQSFSQIHLGDLSVSDFIMQFHSFVLTDTIRTQFF